MMTVSSRPPPPPLLPLSHPSFDSQQDLAKSVAELNLSTSDLRTTNSSLDTSRFELSKTQQELQGIKSLLSTETERQRAVNDDADSNINLLKSSLSETQELLRDAQAALVVPYATAKIDDNELSRLIAIELEFQQLQQSMEVVKDENEGLKKELQLIRDSGGTRAYAIVEDSNDTEDSDAIHIHDQVRRV